MTYDSMMCVCMNDISFLNNVPKSTFSGDDDDFWVKSVFQLNPSEIHSFYWNVQEVQAMENVFNNMRTI